MTDDAYWKKVLVGATVLLIFIVCVFTTAAIFYFYPKIWYGIIGLCVLALLCEICYAIGDML